MNLSEINQKEFFKVGLASSVVLFGFDGQQLQIFIKKEKNEQFSELLLLPSKYVMPNESTDTVILESIKKDLNISDIYIEQLKAFSHVFRNPIGRVINIAYYALVKIEGDVKNPKMKGEWVPYSEIPPLVYDHNEIVDYAKERLKRRFKRRPVGFNLLPEEFTITQMQILYESALGKNLDKRNFRKKIFKSKLIQETGKTIKTETSKKPSKLYRFNQEKYETMTLKGYDFLF